MSTALVVIFNGVEDIEASSIIDILRRGGVNVTVASLEATAQIKTGQGMTWVADKLLHEVMPQEPFNAVVLPGGPGYADVFERAKAADPATEHLRAIMQAANERRAVLGAICGAPVVLGYFGFLKDAVCCVYPACEDQLTGAAEPPREIRTDVDAITHGNIVTSRGPGTSLVFGHSLLASLVSKAKADEVAAAMLIRLA